MGVLSALWGLFKASVRVLAIMIEERVSLEEAQRIDVENLRREAARRGRAGSGGGVS